MAGPGTFHLARIRRSDPDWGPPGERLHDRIRPWLERAGGRLWGTFFGLFGIASDELLVMTCWPEGADVAKDARALLERIEGAGIVDEQTLNATVRPVDDTPPARPGLYVFRWFEVAPGDMDELVRLSAEAWRTFETAPDYAAEPQGLWRPRDARGDTVRMLLVTWYDGLSSWQTSRRPPEEAAARFRERRRLTHSTIAWATRLITD